MCKETVVTVLYFRSRTTVKLGRQSMKRRNKALI